MKQFCQTASLNLGIVFSLLAVCTGCASTGSSTPQSPLSRDDRPFFLSPLDGYPLTMGPTTERRIQQAYQNLVTSGDSAPAVALSHELLASNPGIHPAIVLAAQVNMIDRDFEAALEQLRPVVGELPEYTSGWLLYGRLNEKLDDVVGALVSYTRIADSSSTAAARARELKTRGAEILRIRIESDLDNGRTDDAIRSLKRLQTVAGDEMATLQATAWVARANNDAELELDAVRALHSQNPGDREVTERRAELEMEVGDPSNGMRLMKELVEAYPGDKPIEEKAARAEFLWRLQLLPPDVQAMVQEPQVDRGDFATLVFWLFPEVRYGRAGSARIANDILEHPHRSEIVRVINLGLMDVDPSLHRFEPHRPIQRIEALSSMTRLLADQSPPPVCLGPGSAQVDSSRQRICQLASRCGLVESEDDCLPSATMTGVEVVDLARSSQELVANR